MSRKSQKQRRERLFAEDPHCFWCGCELVPYPHGRGTVPPNAVTLDHVVSRLHPDRSKGKRGKERTVIACNFCNTRRNDYEQASVPLEELWRRSGRAIIEAREEHSP